MDAAPEIAAGGASARTLRVLMVTFPYPPMIGSSGVQRPTKFARFLARREVDVTVLTCHPRAYERVSASTQSSAGPGIAVVRAFAIDAARHLAVRGRYPRWLSIPDRWASWIPAAILSGSALIRRRRPDIIWSTYPIASAHAIAGCLARRYGVPWIADFRDPMYEEEFEDRGSLRARTIRRIDAFAATTCTMGVFTTPGMRDLYAARYAQCTVRKWVVIENGFDEEDFASASTVASAHQPTGLFRLLHSGTVYAFERDPGPVFAALGRLLARGKLRPDEFQLCLRAPSNEPQLRRLIDQSGSAPLVRILPPLPHREAIVEMLSSDGLLILQADNCNRQIPAKAYEYLRAGRPILALTDEHGDTARLVRRFARAQVCSLADSVQIEGCLPEFVASARRGVARFASEPDLSTFERSAQAEILLAHMRMLLKTSGGIGAPIR